MSSTITRARRLTSPIGPLTLGGTEESLLHLRMQDQKHEPEHLSKWPLDESSFCEEAIWLQRYFAGDRTPNETPLRLEGTPFQVEVWKALREIPYGETWSYGKLAAHLGVPRSVRAVGAAVGRNPIAIMVPCHRVVGSNGSLTGFAGGLERKQALLALEQVAN